MFTKRAVDWKAIGQTLLTPEVLGAIIGGTGAPLATYLARRKKKMPTLQRIAELLGAGVLGAGAGAGVGYGGKKGVQALLKLFEKAPKETETETAKPKKEVKKEVKTEEPEPPEHPYYPGLPFGQSEEEVIAGLTNMDAVTEREVRRALEKQRAKLIMNKLLDNLAESFGIKRKEQPQPTNMLEELQKGTRRPGRPIGAPTSMLEGILSEDFPGVYPR